MCKLRTEMSYNTMTINYPPFLMFLQIKKKSQCTLNAFNFLVQKGQVETTYSAYYACVSGISAKFKSDTLWAPPDYR